MPSTLTRPLMPDVRSSVPMNGMLAVSPRATDTFIEVVENSTSSGSNPEIATE